MTSELQNQLEMSLQKYKNDINGELNPNFRNKQLDDIVIPQKSKIKKKRNPRNGMMQLEKQN